MNFFAYIFPNLKKIPNRNFETAIVYEKQK